MKVGQEVRIGLAGFGTIGTGVVKLLQQLGPQLVRRLGFRLTLARIADIDLERDRGVTVPTEILTRDAFALVADPSIDVVVELMGGYDTARRLVLSALKAGKSVVTANKAMLAVHGHEIFAAAEKHGVDLRFEASVGGGIPIVRTLREALAGDRLRAVYGIVNGTSNYILTEMSEQDAEFDTVLRQAQAKGLAEADPSFDVDGIDAAHKLTLLIQLAFGVHVPFEKIPVEGIRQVTPLDIRFARDLGYVIKLLAIAKLHGREVEARVHPTMVPRKHVLADVKGAYNGIAVDGEALGQTFYYGLGAGMMPTATAVLADIVEVAQRRLRPGAAAWPPLGYPLAQQRLARLRPLDRCESEYYLRFHAIDRPGVLGQIAGILGRERISIAAMTQHGNDQGGVVPVVMRTHRAVERNLRRALRQIERLKVVQRPVGVIRIEESLGEVNS